MGAKIIKFDQDAREAILKGVNLLAEPFGRFSVSDNSYTAYL